MTHLITDDHNKEIPGAKPTPWLFYTGVDDNPGRYFEVNSVVDDVWWFSPEGENYPVSDNLPSDAWHDSLGLIVPQALKTS